jgi:hypothetical protein
VLHLALFSPRCLHLLSTPTASEPKALAGATPSPSSRCWRHGVGWWRDGDGLLRRAGGRSFLLGYYVVPRS